MSLSIRLFEAAKKHSDFVALNVGGRQISYSELSDRSLGVAAALLDAGATHETIGIVGQRKVASYVGIIGILYAGCNYVPINPKSTRDRILAVLTAANVRFLVGAAEDLEAIEAIVSDEKYAPIKSFILSEGKAPNGKRWIDEATASMKSPLNCPKEVSEQALAYILFTSGSTGNPKGVEVMHSNVCAYIQAISQLWNLSPGFRASQFHDFSFDPSVSDMFSTWSNGGELCVLPEEELISPFDFIVREKLQIWSSVPSIGLFMKKMGFLKPNSFPDLRISRFAGEPFPQSLADTWQIAAPASSVENHYGPTEATVDVTRHVYTVQQQRNKFSNGIIPIGRSFPGIQIVIIDENGSRVNQGERGEIIFKGPQITKGYLNDTEKTDSVFVRFEWDSTGERWYRSGDLGFYNENGDLECLGRKDNQIKFGGRRVELGEIEATLARYPETRDAVVIPLKDGNQIVIGLVAFTTLAMTKEAETFIRRDSAKHIDRIFFPKKFITIHSFPLAVSGKIDRKALVTIAQQSMATAKLS